MRIEPRVGCIPISGRIKYYRSLLNIDKEELVGAKLSKKLLTSIENGNSKLTITTASILADNINKIAESKGIYLNVSASSLILDEKEYAEVVCTMIKSELDENPFKLELYLNLLSVAKQYKAYANIISLLHVIGEKLYKQGQYDQALEYLSEGLDLSKIMYSNEMYCTIQNRIGTVYYLKENYKEALDHLFDGIGTLKDEGLAHSTLYHQLLYNIALCQNRLLLFQDAYDTLTEVLEFSKDFLIEKECLFEIKMLYCNVLFRLNLHEKALAMYEELYLLNPNDFRILHNLSVVHEKLGHREESYKFLNNSITLQLKDVSKNTSATLYQLAKAYNDKSMYKQALICLENALKNTNDFKQYDWRIDCYYLIFNILHTTNKVHEFEPYAEQILTECDAYIKNEKLKFRVTLLLMQFITYAKQFDFGIRTIFLLEGGDMKK